MPKADKHTIADPREAAPATYRASLDKAHARTARRNHGPVMSIDPTTTELSSPFAAVDEQWQSILLDAFGTRAYAVANTFITQLVGFCRAAWNEGEGRWVPDEDELTAILHIVSAHRPSNEAQAALAAQIAATHMVTMKVAKHVYEHPYDARTIGAFANLARASASQQEALGALKGRKRTARQKITVVKESHVHEHKHVHIAGGGDRHEGQCHEPQQPAGRGSVRAPLPGHHTSRIVLPAAEIEGPEAVLASRRKGRGAKG